MEWSRWLELIQEVGPFFGIMLFFVWRDYRREERLSERVAELEKFIQDKLFSLIEKTNEALNRAR